MTAQTLPDDVRAALLNEGAWHNITLGDVNAAGRELRRLHAENESQAARIAQLEAALAGAEPVSGQCRFAGEKSWGWCAVEHVRMVQADPRYAAEGYEARYLYTHPPASRQPLTDEQRRRILDKLGAHAEGLDGETWDQMVITATEAAHNITGEPA